MNCMAGNQHMMPGSVASALFDRLVEAGDPYAALGAYAHAGAAARPALEQVILATPRLRLIVASAPYAPPDLLDRLSCEASAPLALRLVKNPATPTAALGRLLRGNPDDRLRRYMAAHPR